MASGTPIPDEEIADILTHYSLYKKRGQTNKEACASTGLRVGRRWEVIAHVIQRYASTQVLAKAIIEKGSAKLARRIIEDADVDQSIEVLTRVKVLDPPTPKGGPAESGGFTLSVSAESCGAVMIGVNTNGHPQAALGTAPEDQGNQHLLPAPEEDGWIGRIGGASLDEEVEFVQEPDEQPEEARVLTKKTHAELISDGLAKIRAAKAKRSVTGYTSSS